MKLAARARLVATDNVGAILSWLEQHLDDDHPVVSINSKGGQATVLVEAPISLLEKFDLPKGWSLEPKSNRTLIKVTQ